MWSCLAFAVDRMVSSRSVKKSLVRDRLSHRKSVTWVSTSRFGMSNGSLRQNYVPSAAKLHYPCANCLSFPLLTGCSVAFYRVSYTADSFCNAECRHWRRVGGRGRDESGSLGALGRGAESINHLCAHIDTWRGDDHARARAPRRSLFRTSSGCINASWR